MADETPPPGAAPGAMQSTTDGAIGGPGGATGNPRMQCVSQYVKDLSFESPGAPGTVMQGDDEPHGELKVQVKLRKLGGDNYEVVLQIEIEATKQDKIAFLVELQYAGVYVVSGLAEAEIEPALMIECPRNLYPFARRIIADAVRDGGFPQLMLRPIDFVQLYQMYGPKGQAGSDGNGGGDAVAAETAREATDA